MSVHYEPKEEKNVNNLLDVTEYTELIAKINGSNLTVAQKEFLRLAASKFIRFRYDKMADYYADASLEMRQFMERLHLVVVDYQNAIENGYIQFKEDFNKLIEDMVNE